jgi:hypothetical protein
MINLRSLTHLTLSRRNGGGGGPGKAHLPPSVCESNGHATNRILSSCSHCARELLEFGNTPQKEIAQSLGYKDVASFARAFRKVTGLAPGAHRKRFSLNASWPDDF